MEAKLLAAELLETRIISGAIEGKADERENEGDRGCGRSGAQTAEQSDDDPEDQRIRQPAELAIGPSHPAHGQNRQAGKVHTTIVGHAISGNRQE